MTNIIVDTLIFCMYVIMDINLLNMHAFIFKFNVLTYNIDSMIFKSSIILNINLNHRKKKGTRKHVQHSCVIKEGNIPGH
jgi:hypothetical protein